MYRRQTQTVCMYTRYVCIRHRPADLDPLDLRCVVRQLCGAPVVRLWACLCMDMAVAVAVAVSVAVLQSVAVCVGVCGGALQCVSL